MDRVEAIAFAPMPAKVRNQLITRTYGDIAQAMVDLLGSHDITWCVVGQWASHTIGDFLAPPIPLVGGVITRHFADGNRDVFADIARAHVIFLDTVGEASRSGDDLEAAWSTCRRRLRLDVLEPPGRVRGESERFWDTINEEPAGTKRPNQRALVLGFEAYTAALAMPPSEERSRTILVGNLLLALHEQRHLTMAISLGFRAWLRSITQPSRPFTSTRAWLNRDPGRGRLTIENWWIRIATRFFIRLDLGPDRIRVSKPVPAGSNPIRFVPPASREGSGFGRPTYEDMLAHFWRALEIDGRPSTCWNSLRDRMAYIAALFVEHQRSDRWFTEAGSLLRAPADEDLDQRIHDLLRSTISAEPLDAEADQTHPLPEDLLDELRLRTSAPPVEGGASIADLRGDKAEMQRVLADDLDHRIDFLVGEQGVWDDAVLDRCHSIYDRWRVLMMMALLFRSLPDAYAAAAGVKVIGTVSRLETDPFRRAGETAHFVQELLGDRERWRELERQLDNEVFRSVAGLRTLHSIVSDRLVADGWDSHTYGVPINQEDVLGTALSFVLPFLELAERLGVTIGEADRTALVHFWLGIGHLLGAPPEAITTEDASGRRLLGVDEAASVARLIRHRHHARSLDGVRLTEALIEGVADGFPRRMRWLVRGWMLALGDPATTDLLLVGAGQSHRRAARLAALLRAALRFAPTRPLTRLVLNQLGGRWLKPFMDEGTARPYRRPRKANETGPAALIAAYWPTGCDSASASRPTAGVRPVDSPRRRVRGRRLSRRRRRFRARS